MIKGSETYSTGISIGSARGYGTAPYQDSYKEHNPSEIKVDLSYYSDGNGLHYYKSEL